MAKQSKNLQRVSDMLDGSYKGKIQSGYIGEQEIENDEYTLSFEDINKQAPVHALIIPKNKYKDFSSFSQNASDKEIANFCRSIFSVAKKKGILNNGYRIIINCGPDSNQEVPHLHAHIVGGKNLGPMLC